MLYWVYIDSVHDSSSNVHIEIGSTILFNHKLSIVYVSRIWQRINSHEELFGLAENTVHLYKLAHILKATAKQKKKNKKKRKKNVTAHGLRRTAYAFALDILCAINNFWPKIKRTNESQECQRKQFLKMHENVLEIGYWIDETNMGENVKQTVSVIISRLEFVRMAIQFGWSNESKAVHEQTKAYRTNEAPTTENNTHINWR